MYFNRSTLRAVPNNIRDATVYIIIARAPLCRWWAMAITSIESEESADISKRAQLYRKPPITRGVGPVQQNEPRAVGTERVVGRVDAVTVDVD